VRFQIAAAQAAGQNCCTSNRSEHDAGRVLPFEVDGSAACRLGFGAFGRRRARRLNAIHDEVARHLADADEENSRQDSTGEG
jgi:hypothetical protein